MKSKLIKNEFKSSLFEFITFTIIIISALIVSFIIYPTLNNDILIKISNLNPKIQTIFYLNDNILDANEYYAFIMEYIIILGSIMSTVLATKQILWDKMKGYDEYLFTLPVSRGEIFKNKVLCVLIEILFFNIIFYITSILLSSFTKYNVKLRYIWDINSALLLAQLTFSAIGFLVGSFIKKTRFIYLKTNLAILFFILLAIPERLYNIKIIKYINPFSYLGVRDILLNDGYKYSFIIASGFIIIFSLVISKSIYDEYDT